jgi:hypothetical protein
VDALDQHVLGQDERLLADGQHRRIVIEPARCRIGRDGAQQVDKGGFGGHPVQAFAPTSLDFSVPLKSRDVRATVRNLTPHILGNTVEQAVGKARVLGVEERVRDIEIFVDHAAHRHVGPREQLVGACAQDLVQRAVDAAE